MVSSMVKHMRFAVMGEICSAFRVQRSGFSVQGSAFSVPQQKTKNNEQRAENREQRDSKKMCSLAFRRGLG
jgi:hypothetical protein